MQRLRNHRFRRVDLQLGLCVALLAGIGLARAGLRLPAALVAISLVGGLLMWRRRSFLTAAVVLLAGLSLGVNRGMVYVQKLANYQALADQKVTISVRASNDGVYGSNSQLTFTGNDLQVTDGQKLAGNLYVSGFGLNAVFQGDEVQVTGKLRTGSGQYQAFMSYAQLKLIRHHPSLIGDLRRRFAAGMQTALPEPQASFALGLLIGQRSTLPTDVKQDLLMVGLTHIIAVSGYNLTIILQAARRLLGHYSKRISTGLSLGLIGVFLLLTGSSASIVRAAIVSGLSIWASYYGRQFRPLNLILIAAAITAWANPFYLWSDISWYLSFLAFYGVLVIAPLITARFHHAWQRSLMAGVALESVCAELMTIPIILFTFGQVSLIGLVANVLVVALIPLAMLLSFVAGLAGMIIPILAGWVAWPATMLLTYMLDTAHVLARIPGIFHQNIGLRIGQMLGMYALVPIVTFILTHKAKTPRTVIPSKAEESITDLSISSR